MAKFTSTVEPLYIAATLGEQHFGRYIGVAFIEGLFCTQTVHLGTGFLAVIQRWPLFRGGHLRGVPLYLGCDIIK